MKYALLTDERFDERSVVCRDTQRHRKQLLTRGHELDIALTPFQLNTPAFFLLQYEGLSRHDVILS